MVNITLIILFVCILALFLCNRINKEHFEAPKKGEATITKSEPLNIKQDLEILENKVIKGSFYNETGFNTVDIALNKLEIVFNFMDKSKGFSVKVDNKIFTKALELKKNTLYSFEILIYPLNNLCIILLNSGGNEYNVLYILRDSTFSKQSQKLTITNLKSYNLQKNEFNLLDSSNELFKLYGSSNKYLNVENNIIQLLDKVQLGDKKSIIWNIEKQRGYYTINNIVNNLYLSIKNNKLTLDSVSDKNSRFYIIENNKDSKRLIVINENLMVLNLANLEQSNSVKEIRYEKVENIGNWITYGSGLNIVNDRNQYLSGNINLMYNQTNTPIVFTDDLGQKELIQWIVEDYFNKRLGFYLKEHDEIYLKNNGKYLQILKGNNSPSNSGFEVSLGDKKNDNSKWILKHTPNSIERLVKKADQIYLYHPKMNVYLYSGTSQFKVLDQSKMEVFGSNMMGVWRFDVVAKKLDKLITDSVDYYKFNDDKKYFETKENQWKKLLIEENEKIKANLNQYNKLKDDEKSIIAKMNNFNNEISILEREKCPPRKICLNSADYPCIPQKKPVKKDNVKLYDVVYIKENEQSKGDSLLNSNSFEKCKTLKDFNIEDSEYIKKKEYVPRKGAKLQMSDFSVKDFPQFNELVSIESLPDDKKVSDFKIEELPGFDQLKLKTEYKK
jgi:hypothetical protein